MSSLTFGDMNDMLDFAPKTKAKPVAKPPKLAVREDNLEETKNRSVRVTKPASLFTSVFPAIIEKVEQFDVNKAYHLVKHAEEYEPLLTHETDENGEVVKDKMKMLENYLKSSKNGKVPVSYSQKGHKRGRYFAKYGLSLANIGKQLRHTVAAEYYDDLDMVNAHPTILKFICEQSGIDCENLTKFINNREQYNEMLDIDREIAKKIYLIIINKHDINLPKLKKDYGCTITKQFKDLVNELRDIRDTLEEKYSELADEFRTYKEKQNNTTNLYNFEGSFVNILMCDVENQILQHIIRFFDNPTDCVLCFDGLMLAKSMNATGKIEECERSIKKHIGIDIKLAIKPMTKGFDIPNPDQYEGGTTQSSFDVFDDYLFVDYVNEFRGKDFTSYSEMINELKEKTPRVLIKCLDGNGFYLKKTNLGDGLYDDTKHLREIDFNMQYAETNKKGVSVMKEFSLSQFMKKYGLVYAALSSEPNKAKLDRAHFNCWIPLEIGMNHIEPEMTPEKTAEGLKMILEFYKSVWANGNETYHRYQMAWMKRVLMPEIGITGVALCLISDPGTGKGVGSDFLSKYTVGYRSTVNTVGIDGLAGNFNREILGKRLIIVNEMAQNADEFKKNFERAKTYITDPRICIHGKGSNKLNTTNVGNTIMFSNHSDALHVEAKDRRYAIFEPSAARIGDTKYFKNLIAKCFNWSVGKAFYEYLINLDLSDVDLGKIIMTDARQKAIDFSKPTWRKFLDAVVENETNNELEDGDELDPDSKIFGVIEPDAKGRKKVKGSVFYAAYVKWCKDNGEKGVLGNKKMAEAIKKHVPTWTSNGVNYDIAHISV